jgi:uncharacterized cupin superfamily protein
VIARHTGFEVEVDLEPIAADQVVAGAPTAGATELPAPPGLEVGIWEHTEGTSTDVEVDEVFVVLSGRATVALEAGPVLEIGPGDVVTLAAGARTTWTVHERLRKVYVCPAG